MSKSKTTDVPAVRADNTALASQAANPYAEDAGAGFEELDQDDLAVPWIVHLQSNNPEVNGQNPMPGAKKGLFLIKSTQQLVDRVTVLFAYQKKEWVEWVPHEQGGGLVAKYAPTDDLVIETVRKKGRFGKLILDNGNILKKTVIAYLVLVDDNDEPYDEVAFACSGSKLGPLSKLDGALMRYCTANKCPSYAVKYRMTSIGAIDKKSGKPYENIVLAPASGSISESKVPADSTAYATAKALWTSVVSGERSAKMEDNPDDYPEQDRMEGDDPLV